jgi:hypothetical protein
MKALVVLFASALPLLVGHASCFADDRAEVHQVRFAKGASSATLKGAITGDKYADYKLRAGIGQTMTVTLKTSNLSNYFNVLPPGSKTALFVGATSGDKWSGSLQADGDYTIRVYLMRSAARRNEHATYTLSVGITGQPATTAKAMDAKVAGTPYHATGQVPCSIGSASQGFAQCNFGVMRGEPGNAEVHVTPPVGFKRVLTFADGKVTSVAGANVKAAKSGDLWTVDVNDYEHYRIPQAVISGG